MKNGPEKPFAQARKLFIGGIPNKASRGILKRRTYGIIFAVWQNRGLIYAIQVCGREQGLCIRNF